MLTLHKVFNTGTVMLMAYDMNVYALLHNIYRRRKLPSEDACVLIVFNITFNA